MSQSIITIDSLSKRYRLGQIGATSMRDSVELFLQRICRKNSQQVSGKSDLFKGTKRHKNNSATDDELWALRDVSFDVMPGEVLGIIGRNGAGKSTLLKILSRITEPTAGRAIIRGRVASLLEVGTGFHPELTGRENIFLNGAILGMKKAEIKQKFDEIVAFAEVERFIDTPVKRYSSGMYVRLAFAVAAHLEPELLIVDEVLAVGDAEFQKKCLGKMEEVSKNNGRTVLFVSHNMSAITSLCNKGLLLNQGSVAYSGTAAGAVHAYLQHSKENKPEYRAEPQAERPSVIGVKVLTSEPNGVAFNGKPLTIEFTLYTPHKIDSASFSFQIADDLEGKIIHAWVFDSGSPFLRRAGYCKLTCTIDKLKLYMGNYNLFTYLGSARDKSNIEVLERICPFKVEMYDQFREYPWQPGTCKYLEDVKWKVKESLVAQEI